MTERHRAKSGAGPPLAARGRVRLPLRWAFAGVLGAAAAGGVALFALGLWLAGGWPSAPAEQARAMLVGGTACFVFVAAAALAWLFFERRIARPLATLTRQAADTAAATAPAPLAPPAVHALGDLPGAVAALAARLAKTRHETLRAMGAAAAESEEQLRLLEAILLDLSEAVLVCSLDHRVLLYNRAAVWFVDAAERLGLGRSVFELVERAAVEETLADLTARDRHAAGAAETGLSDAIACRTAQQGAVMRGHMALVRDPAGTVIGYVLTFAAREGPAPSGVAARRAPDAAVGFYDFRLPEPGAIGSAAAARPLDALDYVVFDTETTGMNPTGGDEIVQIAGVRIVAGRLREGEIFDSLVNPGRAIPAASRRVHGIDDTMVADAPPAAEVLPAFRDFAGDAVLVAHNAAFDMRFLAMKEAETGAGFDAPVLDTLLLSILLDPDEPDHTLEGIAGRLGVEIARRHTALGDALTAARIFVHQLDLLRARGIATLGEAIDAARAVLEKHKLRERF